MSDRIDFIVSQVCDFVAYVGGFYGNGGLYDMGASMSQIASAVDVLFERFPMESIAFDSVDRERVRDILIEDFGLVFPQNDVDPIEMIKGLL